MEGDRQAGFGHHQQVVGSVTAGDDLVFPQTRFFAQAGKVVGVNGRIDDVADELAAGDFQFVGSGKVEAGFDAPAFGDIGEAAGQDGAAMI